MSEIKKISVDGVVYDIASTSENPGSDVQEQIDSLNAKTEELDKKISDESTRVDGMIDQLNQNTASSIQTINDNLVQAINTINGGIAAEVTNRKNGDKTLQENLDSEVKERENADNVINESVKSLSEKVEGLGNPSELVEAEKEERVAKDMELNEKIDSEVKTLNETIATVNQNTATSIQTLNDNLVQAINTINGGIDNEIRPELEKAVKYQEFEDGTRKTIQLANHDTISGLDTEGNGYNIAMVSKWNKVDLGSANIQMNLNSSGRVTVNDTEELAYLSDVSTDQDFEALKTQVEENTSKIEEVNTTLVDAIGSLNESINTKTEDINTRIDTEVLQKINELDKNKVGLVETDKNGIKTLNIVLENYASLLGKDTQGALYNLAMVSKWDKADFGSASIELNFNGSKERPTYNDEVELALLTDITGNLNEVNLVKKSDLEYELQVGDRIAGTINIPKDQFFEGSDYNSETHILTLYFQADGESKSQDIDLSDLVDIYTAGNGLLLEGGKFSIKLDPSTDAYLEVTENGLRLVGLKEELNSKASVEELNAEAEERSKKDTELEEKLSGKVDFVDVADQNLPNRKAIVLPSQGDVILSNTEDGGDISLLQYNRWGIVDLGTSTKPINLNTPAGVRPTVQEAGQSGEEAYSIAYTSDLSDLATKDEVALKANQSDVDFQVNALNEKINSINIPTKVSELENDSQYQTASDVDSRIQEVINSAPETLDTLKELADALGNDPNFAATVTEQLGQKATKEELNVETEARTAADTQLQEDLQIEGEARIAADEKINTKLQNKVDYTDISDSENLERKTIQLKNHDSISGLNTDGTGFNIAMVSKWNKVDLGSAGIELNLNGSAERPTYNDDEELALLKDVEDIKVPVEFAFPIRTLQDKVYTQEEIFGWFGVTDVAELKVLINREGQFYLKFGIILTGNPYNYKMPIQYIAFETNNQIKMVVLGLDTSNDNPVKYEIIINLDGTIADGNSNIKVTMINLATENEVSLKANQSDVDFQVNALNEKIDSINVPTKVSELENDSNYQTAQDVDNRIQDLINAAPAELDTLGEIATALKDNESAVGAITSELANKANKSEIPTELPNPEALTIKYNGVTAFSYDGSKSETGNFIVNSETIPMSEEDATTLSAKIETLATKESLESEASSRSNKDAELESKINKVANSKLYYPGVKVDTQKLFALTKESSEDDIKAALQIEVASGGYTLPTAEILDECLGKGYQLLSNWMPVSIVWNGAAYVFYIVGQNYMMKPTGLYTVAIRIVDGTYSVFQAAKVEEFANTDELSTINEKINSINSSITVLSDKLSLLQAKYDSIVAENSEEVIDFQGGNEDINDNSKSFILNNSQITSSTTMNAKSIVINEANLSNDARMKINSGNVEINNLSVSGNFPKANGNAVINVNESEYIVFKDMIFDSSDIYNGIEIGLNSTTLPKNILFENCKFTGAFSNNAILIFGTQNNATITLSNCYFEKVSNALRLSNKTNASGITVNIVNCTVDAWDTLAPWQGFLICQDYTSGSSEEVDTNNLFGNNKITVNFTNLVHNGEKIIPDNLQKVCGTGNDDQIVYIYAEQKDPSNAIPYSENIYPIINFN